MNPLYAYRGIIYLIRNAIDGKCYVGQTIQSFARRYRRCRWWEHTNNPYLKHAVAKHGVDAFTVTILEHSKTLDELNALEASYAVTHNAYSPHGYNLIGCGKNRRWHPDSVALLVRTVVLNDPSGQDVTITNIKGFCRNNGLDERALTRVLKGEHASHRGWSRQGVTDKHHRNNHPYTFYDRTGNRYDVIGLTAFCREHGLVYHAMRSMTQGKISTSQGYALSMDAFSKQRMRHIVTLAKDGVDVTLRNIKKECGAIGLHSAWLYKLINGKVPSYKGWTVKTLSSEPAQDR